MPGSPRGATLAPLSGLSPAPVHPPLPGCSAGCCWQPVTSCSSQGPHPHAGGQSDASSSPRTPRQNLTSASCCLPQLCVGRGEQRGHPRRGGRMQPRLSPLSPEFCFCLTWMLKFKVEKWKPPCSVSPASGGDGTQGPRDPGQCSGQHLSSASSARCHQFQPSGFFSLSVCSSPLPALRVSLSLPSCQRRAAAYANRGERSAENQQRAAPSPWPG